MNLNFDPRIERLKSILKILKLKNLSEENRKKYKKFAFYAIEKVAGLYFSLESREAEKILAKAMDSADDEIRARAFAIILQAEMMGFKLRKRTLLKLKKAEEAVLIANQKPPA